MRCSCHRPRDLPITSRAEPVGWDLDEVSAWRKSPPLVAARPSSGEGLVSSGARPTRRFWSLSSRFGLSLLGRWRNFQTPERWSGVSRRQRLPSSGRICRSTESLAAPRSRRLSGLKAPVALISGSPSRSGLPRGARDSLDSIHPTPARFPRTASPSSVTG